MVDKLADVWGPRDWPFLVEAARRIDLGEGSRLVSDIGAAAGLTPQQAAQAAAALDRRGLIDGNRSEESGIDLVTDVSAAAYFLTGLHPDGDEAVAGLVASLRQAADLVDDPAEKSRLRALADGALGVSREVLGGALTAWLAHQAGA